MENATMHPFSGKLSREETFPKDSSMNGLAAAETTDHFWDDGIFPAVKDSVAGMKSRWLQKETPGLIGEKLLPHEGMSGNILSATIPTSSTTKLVSAGYAPGISAGEVSRGIGSVSSPWGDDGVTVSIMGGRAGKGRNDSSISLSVLQKEDMKAVSSNGRADGAHNRYNLAELSPPGLQRIPMGQPATTQMGVETDVAAAIPLGSGGPGAPQSMIGKISGEGKRGEKLNDSRANLNMSHDSLSQLQDSRKTPPGSTLEAPAVSTATRNPPESAAPVSLRGERQDSLAALAAGQVSVHGGAMSDNSVTGTMPKQVEIGVPLGHMAWEQNLARQVLQAGKKQLHQLHIKLNPSHLGSLEIKLHVDGDSANIAFSSQHAAVREAVEVSLPRLKEMFAGSGINLGNVDVGGQDTGREGGQGMQGGDSLPDGTYPVEGNEEYPGTAEKLTASQSNGAGDQLLDYYA
ncbi:hypothetical protein TBH_C1389 [Thiolapillus brandeum]|uniref:Flagellar hook-length control protein-like C-terminal domain-containing protein n=2 Tax=Thiolapillus brandeum TaxID=1076588 RepID=A0A7U6GIN4_9GAMM|nr:hypothetical protein TBH_C1389 [Thiolapillus brandeum]